MTTRRSTWLTALHHGLLLKYCIVAFLQPRWQSPPLSRGMQYNEVNITIDLEQEFHVAYVWVQMANSPRPGTWILEKSVDHGKTWTPWQYFASSPAECAKVYSSTKFVI